jgi:hypothetical protein
MNNKQLIDELVTLLKEIIQKEQRVEEIKKTLLINNDPTKLTQQPQMQGGTSIPWLQPPFIITSTTNSENKAITADTPLPFGSVHLSQK